MAEKRREELLSAIGAAEKDREIMDWFTTHMKPFKSEGKEWVRLPVTMSAKPGITITIYGSVSDGMKKWLLEKLPQGSSRNMLLDLFVSPPASSVEYEEGSEVIKRVCPMPESLAKPLVLWYSKETLGRTMDGQVQSLWAWYELMKMWNSRLPVGHSDRVKFPKGLHEPRDRPSGHARQVKLEAKQTSVLQEMEAKLAALGGVVKALAISSSASAAASQPSSSTEYNPTGHWLEHKGVLPTAGWLKLIPKLGGCSSNHGLYAFLREDLSPRLFTDVVADETQFHIGVRDAYECTASLLSKVAKLNKKLADNLTKPAVVSKANYPGMYQALSGVLWEPEEYFGLLPEELKVTPWVYNSNSGQIFLAPMAFLTAGTRFFTLEHWQFVTSLPSLEDVKEVDWPLSEAGVIDVADAAPLAKEWIAYADVSIASAKKPQSQFEREQPRYELYRSFALTAVAENELKGSPYLLTVARSVLESMDRGELLPSPFREFLNSELPIETVFQRAADAEQEVEQAFATLGDDAPSAAISAFITQERMTHGDDWFKPGHGHVLPEGPVEDPAEDHDEEAVPDFIMVHGVRYVRVDMSDPLVETQPGVVLTALVRSGCMYVGGKLLAPTSSTRTRLVTPTSRKDAKQEEVFVHDSETWIRPLEDRYADKGKVSQSLDRVVVEDATTRPATPIIEVVSPAVAASQSVSSPSPKGKGKRLTAEQRAAKTSMAVKADPKANTKGAPKSKKGKEPEKSGEVLPGRSKQTQVISCICDLYPCSHTEEAIQKAYERARVSKSAPSKILRLEPPELRLNDVALCWWTTADVPISSQDEKTKQDPLLNENPAQVKNAPAPYHGDRITKEQLSALKKALKLVEDPLPTNFSSLSKDEQKAERAKRAVPKWATAAVSADPLNLGKIAKGEISKTTPLPPGKPRSETKMQQLEKNSKAPRAGPSETMGMRWKTLKDSFKDVGLYSNPRSPKEKQFLAAYQKLLTSGGENERRQLPKPRRRPANLPVGNPASSSTATTADGSLQSLTATLSLIENLAKSLGSIGKSLRGD